MLISLMFKVHEEEYTTYTYDYLQGSSVNDVYCSGGIKQVISSVCKRCVLQRRYKTGNDISM